MPTWISSPPQTNVTIVPVIGNNHALIIAVDTFERQKPLNASKDARKLSSTLKNYGYKDENVKLLMNGLGGDRDAPTGRNIMQALESIAQAAGPDDSILVLFSTHGGVNEKNETFLTPSDESKGNVSTADVRAILSKSKARASILLIDACHAAGQFDKTSASPGALAAGAHRDGNALVTIAGCTAQEYSLESSKTAGGVFTHFLCQGLMGEADRWEKGNKNNEVCLDELYNYTHYHVSQFVQTLKMSKDGKAVTQNPTKLGIQTGEVVLTRFKAPPQQTEENR